MLECGHLNIAIDWVITHLCLACNNRRAVRGAVLLNWKFMALCVQFVTLCPQIHEPDNTIQSSVGVKTLRFSADI